MNNNPESSGQEQKNTEYVDIGIPSVDSAERTFRKILSIAKENQEKERGKEEQDPRKSPRDTLTGLYTRECFERFKQFEFNPDNDDNNIALLFFDLDNLKTTNDTKGHAVGDELIKDASNWLRSVFDENKDYITRVGGDEFLVVSRNHEKNVNFEENLHDRIEKSLVSNPALSISYGITTYRKNIKLETSGPEPKEFEDLDLSYALHQSDIKMYNMKKTNRE